MLRFKRDGLTKGFNQEMHVKEASAARKRGSRPQGQMANPSCLPPSMLPETSLATP